MAELKEWMGEWFPDDESEAICTSETDKENKEQQEQKVPCKRKKALSLSLNKGKKKPYKMQITMTPRRATMEATDLQLLAANKK